MSLKVAQIITDQVIKGLEKAGSWERPWVITHNQNLVSRRPYSGVNVLMLSIDREVYGYTSNYWLTYKQIQELGGNLKKGSKSSIVCFTGEHTPTNKETGEKEEAGSYRFLRYYRLFNADCTDGIEIPQNVSSKLDPIDAAELVIDGYSDKPEIRWGGGRAYYVPSTDRIQIPAKDQFKSTTGYYATLFHELAHSTGHESRLNRDTIKTFQPADRETYSKEELVAELAAAMLCHYARVTNDLKNSTAYLKGWIKPLKDDPKMIISAASQASKAYNYILKLN